METNNTRSKILHVSCKLFAEKGFDGTRVDDIAEQAKINKATIYYYFNSKDDILLMLFQQLIDDAISLVKFAFKEEKETPSETYHHLTSDMYLRWLDNNRDVLKVMIMESLKSSNESPLLFKFTDIILQNEIAAMAAKGINNDNDEKQIIISEFFYSILPSIAYSVYQDKLGRYFGLSNEELRERFIKTVDGIQNLYHKSIHT